MKVYVSMPMKSLSDKEVMENLEEIKKNIVDNSGIFGAIDFIDGIIDPKDVPDTLSEAQKAVWCLGESIKKLATADAIHMASGWQHANGCRVEKMVSDLYVIPQVGEK